MKYLYVVFVVSFFSCISNHNHVDGYDHIVKMLIDGRYLEYDDMSIKKVEKLDSDASFDYKVSVNVGCGKAECVVYFWVELNKSRTSFTRVMKDDNELSDYLIEEAKRIYPDWDWPD